MAGRRILYVIHYPVFGGPHNEALLMAPSLSSRGWETEVLLPDEPGGARDRLERAGLHVECVPLGRVRARVSPATHARFLGTLARDVRRIRGILRERNIEVVVLGGLVNPQAAVAARLEGAAVVWKVLDTRAPILLRAALAPFVLGLADVAMTPGQRVAAVHPGLRRLGDRLATYFPPVDLQRFTTDEGKRRRARQELGFPLDAPIVGTVGNLSPMKRHGDFVAAAAALRSTHPTVRFAILGAGYLDRPEYRASLLRQATSLGLREGIDIVVVDPGDRVADLCPAFDIFWISSDKNSEGIPTAVGEAMALGIPVVTTDAGGVADVISDETVGYVVPPRQPLALARATRPLLDDDDLRASMGAAARVRAQDLFDLERNVEIHDRAFRTALTHSRTRLASQLRAGEGGCDGLDTLLHELVRCPRCRSRLEWADSSVRCQVCGSTYPVNFGIPVLTTEISDSHKLQQASYFDTVDDEYEIVRPHGSPRLYTWLIGQKFRRSVSAISDLVPGATAVTVCGGSGMDAEYLSRAGARVIVTDISVESARRARARARRYGLPITSIVADAEALPFADRAVDLVYVHDGLHHLERPTAGLAEMARVAARAVSVNEPARAAATRLAVKIGVSQEVEDAGNAIKRIDPDLVTNQLQAAGFRIVACGRYAMFYRHEAGPAMRLFSTSAVYPMSRLAINGFNGIAHGLGNKLTVQACR